MKLLVIADIYPSKENPISGIFIKEQIEELRKYHDVLVMVIGRKFFRIGTRSFVKYIFGRLPRNTKAKKINDQSARRDTKRGQNVIRIEYPVFVVTESPFHILNGISAHLIALKKLYETRFRPDLIYTHKSFPAGYVGWKLKKKFNAPVVNVEFQGPFSSYFNEPYLGDRVINTINHIDRTICTGFQLSEIQAYGIRSDRLGNAHNGVDTIRFSFEKDTYKNRKTEIERGKIKLLVVGRIEEAKGVRYLLEAIQILKDEFPFISISIVGPIDKGGGEILDSLRIMKLEKNVHYKGICSNEELPSVINKHDIFVSASLHETFGYTIIEALACGKPVVATRCGEPEKIVNEKVGVLVEKAHSQALAEGIRYVIQNYERYDPEEIREYAVENFSQRVVINRLNDLFEEVLRGT